jgi:hypothetical protein
MKKVRPFEQGELDGLCGIYSIINAVRRIRGGKILKDIDERNELFLEILNYLHKHYHGLVFMIDGISIQSIAGILRDIIEPKYNITRKRPFDKRPDVKLSEFWDSMQSFMKENPSGAILLGLGGKHDHWTVVESITDKGMYVMDSDGLIHFNRGFCTTSARTGVRKKHQLIPTHAYFLS